MLDFDAYLKRIGLSGTPTIAQVHRAHVTSIPFENLDSHLGIPVSLEPEAVERKLVGERRGGYCFEQNLLLKAALEELGAEVDLLLARVRFNGEQAIRPRTHLVMRVTAQGTSWHADVGFGLGSLLDPLPFGAGEEHEQSGWRFRIVEDGLGLVLQAVESDRWIDIYAFQPQPVPFVDIETSNWWICTHPSSPFVTHLMLSIQDVHGTRTSLSDRAGLALTEQTPESKRVTPVAREDLPELIASHFGVHGVSLGDDGRLELAAS